MSKQLTPETCDRCGKQMTDEAEAYSHGYLDCIAYLKSERDQAKADRKRLEALKRALALALKLEPRLVLHPALIEFALQFAEETVQQEQEDE